MTADRAGVEGTDVLPEETVAVKRSSNTSLLNREEVHRIATEFGVGWDSARQIRYPKEKS
jgi:hypothetical protein